MIILKNIEMTLDQASIERAIREVEDFKNGLGAAMAKLIEHLTERGVKIAKAQLISFNPPAFYTRQLYETIQKTPYDKGTKEGEVYVEDVTDYALYVEYGTGIIGEANPHPEAGEQWAYDIHGHGTKGWWYPASYGWWIPKEGKWEGYPMAWTAGMKSRPFMYNTLRTLEAEAEKDGAKLIAEYIP